MLNSFSDQELGNSNRESEMSENSIVEENQTNTSSENIEEEIPEVHTLIQKAVKEQIKKFIAPLTRQLEEMTRLVQGMVATVYPSPYSKSDYSTTSGTATYLSDIRTTIVG